MSDGNNDFSVETFLKKVQEGDNSLLVIGAILVIVPAIFLFFLVGGKGDKKITQQKLRQMTRRKNVFNFASKTDDGKRIAPRSSQPKSNSNWYGAKTEEQKTRDELESAFRAVEKSMSDIEAPLDMEPIERMNFEAEHNYNLCLSHGALQHFNYAEAEEYLFKALEDAKKKNNSFLFVYAYSALCSLYEATGEQKKLEEAMKAYIESVTNLPEGYGGDLKRSVRDMYQSLLTLSKYSDSAKLSEELSNTSAYKSGNLPSNVNVKEVYRSFPIKYD